MDETRPLSKQSQATATVDDAMMEERKRIFLPSHFDVI
jgi:hypothetical protein